MKTITIIFSSILLIISNIVVAQDFPTRGEVYDYDVGDVFHTELDVFFGHVNDPGGSTELKIVEVIDKNLSDNLDTIYYSFFVQKISFSENEPVHVFTEDTVNSSITNLSGIIEGDEVVEGGDAFNGRKSVKTSLSWENGADEHSRLHRWTIGCGKTITYHRNWSWNTMLLDKSRKALVYFKKGDEEWGEELVLVGLEEEIEESSFEVFPNPVSDQLIIKSDFNTKYEIHIYNSMGQFIEKIASSSSEISVEVEHYLSGIYIAHIVGNDGLTIEKRKFIKH